MGSETEFGRDLWPSSQLVAIEDITAEVSDGREVPLNPRKVNKLIIHRTGKNLKAKPPIDWGNTGRDIIPKLMKEAGDALGHQVPYTFFVTPFGHIEQALKLYEHGPHAAHFNSTGVGIACISDPRVEPLREPQYRSLVSLCAILCDGMGIGPNMIYGHTQLPGSSKDRNKECPGSLLSIDILRRDVRLRLGGMRNARLFANGISVL